MSKIHNTTPATNKLSIYLIKETCTKYERMIRPEELTGMRHITINGIGRLYFKKSAAHVPGWINKFFLDHSSIDPKDFLTSTSSALLITKIDYQNKTRYFAIPFGYGRHLLSDNCYVERFGLRTALNLIPEEGLRQLDKRTFSYNPRLSREQVTNASNVDDFDFDFDRDFVQAISGDVRDEDYGSIVTGKDAFSLSTHVDLSNILDVLQKCLITYNKTDYQTRFKWVDKLQDIKDHDRIDKLNGELIKLLKKDPAKIGLSVPDIVDWSKISGFKYSLRKKGALYPDLKIKDLIADLGSGATPTIDEIENGYISIWGEDEKQYIRRWPIYKCLNMEITTTGSSFVLADGKWFEVEREFVSEINTDINKIHISPMAMPLYKHDDEEAYNLDAAKYLGGECLDRKTLTYGGGRSKIEFCDILLKSKKLLHIKKYSGSSVLSHLFNQALVSSNLLAEDDKFRKELRSKIVLGTYQKIVPLAKFDARDYEIVIGIIGQPSGPGINLPFFSKITLRRVVKDLKRFGYEVSLKFIDIA